MTCTDTEVGSGIARASGKSVLVETLKTDVTNSILEIRFAAYYPIFGTQLLYLKPDRGTQLSNLSYDSSFTYRKYRLSGCDSCIVTGSVDPVVVTPVSRTSSIDSGCDSRFVTGSIDLVVVTPVSRNGIVDPVVVIPVS